MSFYVTRKLSHIDIDILEAQAQQAQAVEKKIKNNLKIIQLLTQIIMIIPFSIEIIFHIHKAQQ